MLNLLEINQLRQLKKAAPTHKSVKDRKERKIIQDYVKTIGFYKLLDFIFLISLL